MGNSRLATLSWRSSVFGRTASEVTPNAQQIGSKAIAHVFTFDVNFTSE